MQSAERESDSKPKRPTLKLPRKADAREPAPDPTVPPDGAHPAVDAAMEADPPQEPSDEQRQAKG